MHEEIKRMIEFSKLFVLERVAVDRVVCNSPALVASMMIKSDGGGEADAVVYDGHSTNDPIQTELYCVDEAMDGVSYSPPAYFRRGIYINIGTNVLQVTFHYMPLQH